MMAGIMATAEIDVHAAPDRVWMALTDPAQIEKYMFGAKVTTDWVPGSPITWAGEYEGRAYEDKGEVLDVQPGLRLRMSHYSPLSGQPDVPASYHTLTYLLAAREHGTTHVRLSQDNNGSEDEAKHSAENWSAMLRGLKDYLEN